MRSQNNNVTRYNIYTIWRVLLITEPKKTPSYHSSEKRVRVEHYQSTFCCSGHKYCMPRLALQKRRLSWLWGRKTPEEIWKKHIHQVYENDWKRPLKLHIFALYSKTLETGTVYKKCVRALNTADPNLAHGSAQNLRQPWSIHKAQTFPKRPLTSLRLVSNAFSLGSSASSSSLPLQWANLVWHVAMHAMLLEKQRIEQIKTRLLCRMHAHERPNICATIMLASGIKQILYTAASPC